MELPLLSINELPNVAKRFLDEFGHRTCFAFYAEMGSGKTTFISAVLKAMGVQDLEGSPTYSLVNVYESPAYGKVFHFDLFRLKSQIEAYDIGIEEMLYGGGVCFIEWPEKMLEMLPDNTIWVYLRVEEDLSRIITIKHED